MRSFPKSVRSKKGSAISEMPPAMFLLLFFAVFPVISLVFFGVVFASCVALNNIELREASRTPRTQMTSVLNNLQNNWQNNGLGKLAGIAKTPQSKIMYTTIGTDPYVGVSTTFTVKPILVIPFFDKIPGLGAPWTFSIYNQRVLENPNYAYL